MKKCKLFILCASLLALLVSCGNPTVGYGPVLDPPEEKSITNRDISSWVLDKPNDYNAIMFFQDTCLKLCYTDTNNNTTVFFDDAILTSSDRSVVDTYTNGVIETKKTGHVVLKGTSKKNNMSFTLNAFVLTTEIKSKTDRTEISIEVPEGIGDIEFYRIDGKDNYTSNKVMIGALRKYIDENEILPGNYIFNDWFIDGSTDYTYSVGAYCSKTGSGNKYISDSIKTQTSQYAKLNVEPEMKSYDPETGIFTFKDIELPKFDKYFTYTLIFQSEDNKYIYYTNDIISCHLSDDPKLKGKKLTLLGLTARYYDNKNYEGCYYWYPYYEGVYMTIKNAPSTIPIPE